MSWRDEAPCKGHTEDHFPSSEDPSSLKVRRAKRHCARCPFRRQCLEAVFTPGDRYVVGQLSGERFVFATPQGRTDYPGIWAGTTTAERRAVAHLPIPERIAVLEAWFRSQTRGRFAVATEEEMTG